MDTKFFKLLLFVNALVPLILLGYDWTGGNLGANPAEFFLRTTGVLAIIFLGLSLAVTPLRKAFGWNQLIKLRRMLGVFSFFYAVIHLSAYTVFDKGLNIAAIASDIAQRPFIALGFAAFVLMAPLAVTSTNGMIKRLGGKRWQRLHKLAYPIAILGILHFYLIQKSDVRYPVMFGIVFAVLLGYRIYGHLKPKTVPARQTN